MNPKVEEKFLEYLREMESVARGSSDFVVEQAPQVVQEFIAWNIVVGC